MKYQVVHYWGEEPPVYGAVKDKKLIQSRCQEATKYTIDIDDLHDFVNKYGPIKLYPPQGINELWFICLMKESKTDYLHPWNH